MSNTDRGFHLRFSAMQIRNFSFSFQEVCICLSAWIGQSHKARSAPLCSAEEPLHLPERRSRYENSQVGKGGSPPLNVEFAQHYLQRTSVTSCFPSEIISLRMNDQTH